MSIRQREALPPLSTMSPALRAEHLYSLHGFDEEWFSTSRDGTPFDDKPEVIAHLIAHPDLLLDDHDEDHREYVGGVVSDLSEHAWRRHTHRKEI